MKNALGAGVFAMGVMMGFGDALGNESGTRSKDDFLQRGEAVEERIERLRGSIAVLGEVLEEAKRAYLSDRKRLLIDQLRVGLTEKFASLQQNAPGLLGEVSDVEICISERSKMDDEQRGILSLGECLEKVLGGLRGELGIERARATDV